MIRTMMLACTFLGLSMAGCSGDDDKGDDDCSTGCTTVFEDCDAGCDDDEDCVISCEGDQEICLTACTEDE